MHPKSYLFFALSQNVCNKKNVKIEVNSKAGSERIVQPK